MKWLKWIWIGVLALILVIGIKTSFADKGTIETYKPSEIFSLSIHLTNKTGEVTSANCTARILNNSIGFVKDLYMNEVGNGWYNTTYNTSKVGKYFCRQNCTSGRQHIAETCDFIIQGDSEMNIAIVMGVGIFVFILIGLAIMTKQLILRAFFGILGFGAMLILINISSLIAKTNGADAKIITMLFSTYKIGLWVLYVTLAIAVIYGIYGLLEYLRGTAGMVREKPNLQKRRYWF